MSCRFPGTLVESVKPNSFGGKGLLSGSGGLSLPFLTRQNHPGSRPARWLRAGCRLLRESRAVRSALVSLSVGRTGVPPLATGCRAELTIMT